MSDRQLPGDAQRTGRRACPQAGVMILRHEGANLLPLPLLLAVPTTLPLSLADAACCRPQMQWMVGCGSAAGDGWADGPIGGRGGLQSVTGIKNTHH